MARPLILAAWLVPALASASGVIDSEGPIEGLQEQIQPQARLEGAVATGARPELTTGFGGSAEVGFRGAGRAEPSNYEVSLGLSIAHWSGDANHQLVQAQQEGLRLVVRKAFTQTELRPYLGAGFGIASYAPQGLGQPARGVWPTVYEAGVRTRTDLGLDLAILARLTWVDPWRTHQHTGDPAFFELGFGLVYGGR